MTQKFEEVKQTPSKGYANETTFTHPAFAQISATRVNGHINLYGSELKHQNFISICISTSELNRGLSHDWPFPRKQLIEVNLSEAQWANFISTPNSGSGTQCTIRHFNGEYVPQISKNIDRREQFDSEFQRDTEKTVQLFDALVDEISKAKLSKSKTDDLLSSLATLKSRYINHGQCVAEQFNEYMDKTTVAAKVEVEAFVESKIRMLGLNAISDKSDETSVNIKKIDR